MNEFEREESMSTRGVWEYLGISRATLFEMMSPAHANYDPLLPKPDRLFGSRNDFRKGDVYDYKVARRAAARLAAAGSVESELSTVTRTGPLTAAFAKTEGTDPQTRPRQAGKRAR